MPSNSQNTQFTAISTGRVINSAIAYGRGVVVFLRENSSFKGEVIHGINTLKVSYGDLISRKLVVLPEGIVLLNEEVGQQIACISFEEIYDIVSATSEEMDNGSPALLAGSQPPNLTVPPVSSGILDDVSIRSLCQSDQRMITPFSERTNIDASSKKIPSYGLSAMGYDIRLEPKFKMFTRPMDGTIIDVMDFNEEQSCTEVSGNRVILPPGGFLIASTKEYFNMPDDTMAICLGKSTWARIGAIVNVTPLEPGWSGNLVVEITNGTNHPMAIYADVGIAQLVFFKSQRRPERNYRNLGGKYQNQTGITSTKL